MIKIVPDGDIYLFYQLFLINSIFIALGMFILSIYIPDIKKHEKVKIEN